MIEVSLDFPSLHPADAFSDEAKLKKNERPWPKFMILSVVYAFL
jgi:hypothetical protein